MKKVLYIKANPKDDQASKTFQMSESFINAYKLANPEDEITTLDLYAEGIKFLDSQMLVDMFTKKDTIMHKYAHQFADADRFVIAAPLWNLGMPAILKAYFDYVTMKDVTFYYSATGAVGMLSGKGKKVMYIVSRGGDYDSEQMASYDTAKRYITTIMGFMGVQDITTLSLDKANILTGEALENALQKSIEKAKELAASF